MINIVAGGGLDENISEAKKRDNQTLFGWNEKKLVGPSRLMIG